MTAESYALLATIAAIDRRCERRAATKPIAPFAKEYAKQVAADDKAMTAPIDAVIASLPAEVETSRAPASRCARRSRSAATIPVRAAAASSSRSVAPTSRRWRDAVAGARGCRGTSSSPVTT